MSALHRLAYMMGGGGGGGAPDEEPPRRRHHLHHHHHDKDYTVTPTGGNVPVIIPPDEEVQRHRSGHRHRHHGERTTTAPPSQENAPRPRREIDPEFKPKKSHSHKRSSVSSNGATGSTSSLASSGGVEIRGDRRSRGESPPPTPRITTTPPTPSPLEQARRSNLQSPYRSPPPYHVTPHQDREEYTAFSPVRSTYFQEGPQRRDSDPAVPSELESHPGAVEIGSSGSGAPPPKSSTLRLDERKAPKPTRRGPPNLRSSIRENDYDFLKPFDTVFVVDDSASMAGEYWDQLGRALGTITNIATKYDSDGVDIYFLNSNQYDRKNVTSPEAVWDLFNNVQPAGITPTGGCLDRILRDYLEKYTLAKAAYTSSTTGPGPYPTIYNSLPKPLNIIVLTDGEPTDELEDVIVAAARSLEELNAPLNQVGVQFVQIGNEEGAREGLEELDDQLHKAHDIRDMVDFTPFVEREKLSGGMILKALLGAVNRKYDRWKNEFSNTST